MATKKKSSKKSGKKSAKASKKSSKAAKKSSKVSKRSSKTFKKSGAKSPAKRGSVAMAAPPPPPPPARFAGFDTGSYPGDNVMEKWFGDPYMFTGYYLEAPCHSAPKYTPWMGHWKKLKQIGWGLVVVYVGRQASGCGSTMLTRAQGLADASDAISKAKSDALPGGAIIFLDVELMDPISPKMIEYMRGWLAGMLTDKSYQPGIYAHWRNAVALFNAAQQEYAAQGEPGGAPAFWVVRVPGGATFNVNTSSPQDLNNFANTPISFASVWQGKIDIASETHVGIKFGPVDQDVADTNNPSKV